MKTWITVAVALHFVLAAPAAAQTYEDEVVQSASQVLQEIMAVPVRRIPESLLADAKGIAIIPGLIKGGFVVGVRHGRGVVVVRDAAGRWRSPVFVTLTGGSFGWQIGVQATDVVLVFKTYSSIEGLMRGKFTLGVDAAAAAGPVGREASAATDASLKAEIYSYSRSRGLFAGLALDGSALQVDARANAAYYGTALLPAGQASAATIPASGTRLLEQIARYTGTGAPAATGQPTLAPKLVDRTALVRPADSLTLRRQLADASRRLEPFLDDHWKKYLELPPELYQEDPAKSQDAIRQALARYDNVARSPEYRPLAEQPEFRTTHELLKQYSGQQAGRPGTLSLPAPPR